MKSQIRIRTVLINGKVVEKRINGKKMEEKQIKGQEKKPEKKQKKKYPIFLPHKISIYTYWRS